MKDNHTPEGEQLIFDRENVGIVYGQHYGLYMYEEGSILNSGTICDVPCDLIDAKDKARLIAGSYNSYKNNCGPHAVECAEGDLLGECLKAIYGALGISTLWAFGGGDWKGHEGEAEALMDMEKSFQDILAKTKGE